MERDETRRIHKRDNQKEMRIHVVVVVVVFGEYNKVVLSYKQVARRSSLKVTSTREDQSLSYEYRELNVPLSLSIHISMAYPKSKATLPTPPFSMYNKKLN